ncbi:hypothetical protein TNCV_3001111 [Trichonephila clavipes]|nr:hypothetical protein TNCV_3001111 [Trichonephila clavipes]
MAPFRLQLVKLLQIFGKLVRWCNTKRPRAPPRARRWESSTRGLLENFCCSVPLTTTDLMHRPTRRVFSGPSGSHDPTYTTYRPRDITARKKRVGIPRAWVTGRVLDEDVHVRGSHFVGRGGEPGMILRDAHHLGITAIAGNRGDGEFDGHWLALVTLA